MNYFMQVFLTKQCLSLTGILGRGFGYNLRRSKNGRFFSQRCPKGFVPPDGHWLFIVLCAELAQNKLHITDIKVSGREIKAAVSEAGRLCPAYKDKEIFNAERVLTIKKNLCL